MTNETLTRKTRVKMATKTRGTYFYLESVQPLSKNFKQIVEKEMRIFLAKEINKSVKRSINYKKMQGTTNYLTSWVFFAKFNKYISFVTSKYLITYCFSGLKSSNLNFLNLEGTSICILQHH